MYLSRLLGTRALKSLQQSSNSRRPSRRCPVTPLSLTSPLAPLTFPPSTTASRRIRRAFSACCGGDNHSFTLLNFDLKRLILLFPDCLLQVLSFLFYFNLAVSSHSSKIIYFSLIIIEGSLQHVLKGISCSTSFFPPTVSAFFSPLFHYLRGWVFFGEINMD